MGSSSVSNDRNMAMKPLAHTLRIYIQICKYYIFQTLLKIKQLILTALKKSLKAHFIRIHNRYIYFTRYTK